MQAEQRTMQFSGPTKSLLRWGARNCRNMPWRAKADVYSVAVAEILLQKTKGSDAEPIWRKLIETYPNALRLANATNARLLSIVSPLGLGKQRVNRLKAMSAALVAGEQQLPGIGSYGSAVIALATGRQSPSVPVDGNIARVVCRFRALRYERGEPRKKPQVKETVGEILKTQTTAHRKLQLIYALVDLGATVCKVGVPLCGRCPLSRWCLSALDPSPETLSRTVRIDAARTRANGGGTASET